MKIKFYLLLMALAFSLTACYDDSEIRERVENLEDTAIVSINNQLKSMSESIVSMEEVSRTLVGMIDALQGSTQANTAEINALKSLCSSLDAALSDLREYMEQELSDTKDWLEKNALTLDKFNMLVDELSNVKNTVDNMSEHIASIDDTVTRMNDYLVDLDSAINKSLDSVKDWVKQTLEGYYTSEEMDAKLKALGDRLDIISKSVQNLLSRIQSLVFVPRYNHASVYAWYSHMNSSYIGLADTVDFRIRPAALAKDLANKLSSFSMDAVLTATKSSIYRTELDVMKVSAEDDILSVVFSSSSLSKEFFRGEKGARISLVISDGNNDRSSEYIPLIAKEDAAYIPCTSLILSQNILELQAGESASMTVTTLPSAILPEDLIWRSSDSSIATVDEHGIVSALKEGITTISVLSRDNTAKDYCTVTVLPVPEEEQ